MLLDREKSVLLIVDIQEKLAPAISGIDNLLDTVGGLKHAAQILGVPIVLTEHCPDRIGVTVASLRADIPEANIIAKVHFNAMQEEGCQAVLRSFDGRQPIVCGTEAHVCVLQTVFGLKEHGLDPVVVADAVGSRKQTDYTAAINRMTGEAITIVSAEMVLFEWLKRGDTDEFRKILPVIKSLQGGARETGKAL